MSKSEETNKSELAQVMEDIDKSTKVILIDKETGRELLPYEAYTLIMGKSKLMLQHQDSDSTMIMLSDGYSILLDSDPKSKLNQEFLHYS